MWIDTHCHLDAAEFDSDRAAVVQRAAAAGVHMMVIPSVNLAGLEPVRACAHQYGYAYALGLHPLALDGAHATHVAALREVAQRALADPRFVAIGEIGLDFLAGSPPAQIQEWFYLEQLGIAADLGLPVILHVRRSADRLLYHLRRSGVRGGIAHAFNGSAVQAQGFLECGLRLGFGGAATYDGSLRIRRYAAQLPADALVLETDAPDMPAQWLRSGGTVTRNEPAELPAIARTIAELRAIPLEELAAITGANAVAALPRLGRL
jgi:TatD DNase family protein